MKNKKNRFVSRILFSFITIALLLVLTNFVSAFATSNIGLISNSTGNIQEKYSSSENLNGFINLSLDNEPGDSILSFIVGDNSPIRISLLAFLQKVHLIPLVHYQCSTNNCGEAYTSNDPGTPSKVLSMDSGVNVTIGFKLTEIVSIDNINNFSINFSSDASESCYPQLKIEIPVEYYSNYVYNSNIAGDSYCADENYGCFDSSQSHVIQILNGASYCSVIPVISAAALEAGAVLSGSGDAAFEFKANGDRSCNAQISSSGKISCKINMSITSPQNVTVCMTKKSGADYSLAFEDSGLNCGFVYSTSQIPGDLQIYLRPISYALIGNKLVRSSQAFNFESTLKNYLADNYNNNCSLGCFIPIKLASSSKQNVTINQFSLLYNTGTKSSNNIYLLQNTVTKIKMPFTMINLNDAGFKVPIDKGNYSASLRLNDVKVFDKIIQVVFAAKIDDLFPTEVPAGVDTNFQAIVSGINATKYVWVFTNNTFETTTPFFTYRYDSPGVYSLRLTVKNSLGESNKTFTINVISPKNYINQTIPNSKSKISSLLNQINGLPTIVKTSIDNQLNLTLISDKLASLELDYKNSGNDSSRYVSIASALSAITLPNQINLTRIVSGSFFFNKESINLGDLSSVSSEEYNSQESIKDAIFGWFIENLEVNADIKVYSAVYNSSSLPLVSYVNFKINPKSSFDSIFAFIKLNSFDFSGGSDAKTNLNGKGFRIDDLSSGVKKSVELVIPGEISSLDLPVYFFPKKSELSLITKISACNYNGVCESSLGENFANCNYDCKPWSKIIWGWVFVLILFFVLYIIAQEWYKRNYENSLFKTKDDLYNLINFIDNAEKQGLDKSKIFSKLREKNWSSEQINYAFKKYHGERTGMFEIPIFRFFENKKVENEIENRKTLSNSNVPSNSFINPSGFKNFGNKKL